MVCGEVLEMGNLALELLAGWLPACLAGWLAGCLAGWLEPPQARDLQSLRTQTLNPARPEFAAAALGYSLSTSVRLGLARARPANAHMLMWAGGGLKPPFRKLLCVPA